MYPIVYAVQGQGVESREQKTSPGAFGAIYSLFLTRRRKGKKKRGRRVVPVP
jgi:hypothetical protein